MKKLKEKVALITGGASGIGKASAELFSEEGAKILVVDVDRENSIDVVESIKQKGGTAAAFIGDISKSSVCREMIERCEDLYGGLDILFNNAGIMHADDGDAENAAERIIDLTFAINVKGVIFGCKYGIPLLRKGGGGSIINTASFVARLGAATPQLAYTASKGAVLSMTRELAVVHARENIRVNALSPGPLKTDLLMNFLDTEEKRHRRLVHIPMGRFGEASEMAKAALFLASDDSSYMTGTEFLVDGGITAAYVTPE